MPISNVLKFVGSNPVGVRIPPSAPTILESSLATDDPPDGLSVCGGKLGMVNLGQVGVGLGFVLPKRRQ
jgi:hypothetical protein